MPQPQPYDSPAPATPKPTRGERNNNPGNLRKGLPYLGLSSKQTDKSFAQFDEAFFGLRALALDLLNKELKHSCSTVPEFISLYAPSNENDTRAYIQAVCAKSQWTQTQKISPIASAATHETLTASIIYVENHRCFYSPAQLAEAAGAAFQYFRLHNSNIPARATGISAYPNSAPGA